MIKEILGNYGISMAELSRTTGIPYRTIQNWARGERPIPEYMPRLIEAYLAKERNKMEKRNWFVANDNGDLIGHDMCKADAITLAEEMQEKEPDAGWEAMEDDD